MIGAFSFAAGVAAVVLAVFGGGVVGTRHALEATARVSFVLFWLAYAGGASATLFGAGFAGLARQARGFGLGFASAHAVHVALVIWLYHVSATPPVSRTTAVFFSVALMWTYVLAVLSIDGLSRRLNPGWWRRIRWLGSEYIAYAFLVDFASHSLRDAKGLVAYLPFVAFGVAGTFLRVLAWISRYAARNERRSGMLARPPEQRGPSSSHGAA